MAASLAGDKSRYRQLLTELRAWLSAYFTHRVHPNAVEDLVQDALLSVHHKRHTYDPEQPFGPWVNAVARYRWIDYLRKRMKYVETSLDTDSENPVDISVNDSDPTVMHDLNKLLEYLPEEQAAVIRMARLQGLSIAEISDATGHSQSSVKVMIHRGIKKMRQSIEALHHEG